MSRSEHYELGMMGEKLALDYLKKNRFKILETNYRSNHGEIDIIARKKKTLFFIEIKTRSSDAFGTPAESVTAKKQEHLIKTAEYYLYNQRRTFTEHSFSVIEIYPDGNDSYEINLIEDAFYVE